MLLEREERCAGESEREREGEKGTCLSRRWWGPAASRWCLGRPSNQPSHLTRAAGVFALWSCKRSLFISGKTSLSDM